MAHKSTWEKVTFLHRIIFLQEIECDKAIANENPSICQCSFATSARNRMTYKQEARSHPSRDAKGHFPTFIKHWSIQKMWESDYYRSMRDLMVGKMWPVEILMCTIT